MRNKPLIPMPLLDESGIPTEYGYSVSPIIDSNMNKARPKLRRKEWDFYQISTDRYTLQITFGHISYAGAVSATLFGYNGERYQAIIPMLFPLSSLNMAGNAATDCVYAKRNGQFVAEIKVAGNTRHLKISGKSKKYGVCEIDILLSYPASDEGILVVTPFEKSNQFYHNYKQCCMRASGHARFGNVSVVFSPDKDYSLIDWGRGVLPYSHKWWWGNGSQKIGNDVFGFNIGVFGDNRLATENTLFFNGKAHKIDDVNYRHDNGLNEDWIFTSSDSRFEMTMSPIYDNHTETNALIAHNHCHQVFGRFNGTVTLDDGKQLEIHDMLAFVEEANNRW